MTGNSKTAPIDLFPGQLLGCTTTAPTATAPCMSKYHRAQFNPTAVTQSTIPRYNGTTVPR